MTLHRIAPFRITVQFTLLAAALLIPFLSINGNPALRMDIAQRTLYLAGAAVRIDQFFLVLLSILVLVAVFLLLTVVLGRVWCGWMCPQTVFNDLVELMQKNLRKLLPQSFSRVVNHVSALLLSAAVSFNLLSWFIAPAVVLQNIATFHAHPVVTFSFVVITVLMYLNLVVVQRLFCRSYCPYGRFQAALLDNNTLNLAFLEATSDQCVRCGSCVRVCPMGIDIRGGFQIECINCGRCIDACRGVMERLSNRNGLIAYRFGGISGARLRIGSKSTILALLVCMLSAALAWGIFARTDTAFSVQRIAAVETKTSPDGSQVQAWKTIIGNRGQLPAVFSLNISALPGLHAQLLGPVSSIRIAPNENRQVSFFIRYSTSAPVHQPFELKLSRDGVPVSTIRVTP